jgi:cell division transport system permease protein
MLKFIQREEKVLGRVTEKRQYDLPLNKDAGTGFLILLVALMSFLTVLAVAASFALSAMTDRWTTGLENKVTVEIPATDSAGNPLKAEDIARLTAQVAAQLQSHPAVAELHVLTQEEIADLVKPWLGENMLSQNFPVPGLISLTLHGVEDQTLKILEGRIQSVAPQARLDTHESWLKDLLRFTNALRFSAFLLIIIIGFTMATAVAGAIRSRMAVHSAEVELLHFMGAADRYIARQFQRHSLILALRGGLAGLAAAAVALFIIGWLSGEMSVSLLPDFSLHPAQIILIGSLPALIALLATVTAGRTVRRVLETLP